MYKGIQNITSEDKQLIKVVMAKWTMHRSSPVKEDVRMLFRKYHEYVYNRPNDTSCPSCVQFIFDYWTKQIGRWEMNV